MKVILVKRIRGKIIKIISLEGNKVRKLIKGNLQKLWVLFNLFKKLKKTLVKND